MSALKGYLEELHRIRASGLATNERSYYPALDSLFQAIGGGMTPPVAPIHDVKDQGAGHPDFVLEVEESHDLRAAVEAKGPTDAIEDIVRSEQVKRYLTQHDPVLVTNLRDFALVRTDPNGQPEEFMRHTLASSEVALWQTPIPTLVTAHERALSDLLTNVMLWDAKLTRPRDLARALARYARNALGRLEAQPAEALASLRSALSDALGLHFTDTQGEHFFRSSLVQTLFYGLFSAWVVWNRRGAPGGEQGFRWREAGDYLSLPVLRELFENFAQAGRLQDLNVRQPLEWAEAMLRRANWSGFSAAFDESDAVNYFYEPFLEAYDPDLREQLGVWYTPREIIRYQVARVDRLLREELGKPLGLADSDVLILDPATGTGGYPLEVLRVIDATLREQGVGATRAMLLRRAATKRVFGFEILPAPFVVAQLQLATLLANLGAPLEPSERTGVYLTNALTGWQQTDAEQMHFAGFPQLKKEVERAAEVKHSAMILVVLGNPPYRGAAGVAEDEESDLIQPYYEGIEQFDVQPRSVNDLYVRFFRLAERQIAETTGRGIVSYISNSNWLDALSLPVMRKRLLDAFDTAWIDNLNGGGRFKGSRGPDGKPDRSVFEYVGKNALSIGITVSTAITTLIRRGPTIAPATVWYRDLWGQGQEKRESLAMDARHNVAAFQVPYSQLQPEFKTRFALIQGGSEESYLTWPMLPQIFARFFSGVETSRDPDLISIDREILETRMRQYFDARLSDAQVGEVAPTLMKDASRYDAAATRKELLRTSGFRYDRIVRVAYRPLDDRWLYWEGTTKLLNEKRVDFFEQVFNGNLYLSASMQSRREPNSPTIVDKFGSRHLQDPYSQYFPLYVRETQGTLFADSHPHINIRPEMFAALPYAQTLGEQARADIGRALFYHILATAYAPAYKSENYSYLMGDWPRIPIPAQREALEASAQLGQRVADLLRPDVPFTPAPELRQLGVPTRVDAGQLTDADLRVTVRYSGVGKYEPPRESASGPVGGRLWWNTDCFWHDVPPEVWGFTIGGYPVIKKWLDYRHESKLGRPLRLEEILYVQEMIQRIASLLALGPRLDANYVAIKADALPLDLARLGKQSLVAESVEQAGE